LWVYLLYFRILGNDGREIVILTLTFRIDFLSKSRFIHRNLVLVKHEDEVTVLRPSIRTHQIIQKQ